MARKRKSGPDEKLTVERIAQGKRLAELMDRVKLTVEDVRIAMGVSKATVYNWRSGEGEMDITTRVKLAGLLQLERVGDLSPTDFDPPAKYFQRN